jgi:FkbM family methyltransferase
VPAVVDVVDIGANSIDGPALYAGLLASGSARVVGFDPNPTAIQRLNLAKSVNERYLPLAIGDGQRHTLHICSAEGMTSLLEPNSTVLNLFGGFPEWGKVVRREAIQTVRLDDVPEVHNVDLLKLDIQGAELLVLQHAERCLSQAVVVQTEVEFVPLYKQQPLFADIDSFMRERGFWLHKFAEGAKSRLIAPVADPDEGIYKDKGQLLYADAVYIKNPTRFADLPADKLINAALILNDVYGSPDMAVRALLPIGNGDLAKALYRAVSQSADI